MPNDESSSQPVPVGPHSPSTEEFPQTSRPLPRIIKWALRAVEVILGICAVVAALIGGVAATCGIYSFVVQTPSFFKACSISTGTGTHSPSTNPMLLGLIHCVELFIAAPLPFLAITALFNYVREWGKESNQKMSVHHHRLQNTELLLFTLLLSLLTVNLVSELIEKNAIDETRFIELRLVLIVVGGYLLLRQLNGTEKEKG